MKYKKLKKQLFDLLKRQNKQEQIKIYQALPENEKRIVLESFKKEFKQREKIK